MHPEGEVAFSKWKGVRDTAPFIENNYRATRTIGKFNRYIKCNRRRCAMNNQIIIIDPIERYGFASYANIASIDCRSGETLNRYQVTISSDIE